MDPRQLFARSRTLWPDMILLRSERDWEEGQPIRTIVHIYDAIEDQVESDDWLSLGAWAFHQALTTLARHKIAAGNHDLRPSDVTFEAFDRFMRLNLADPSWTEVRESYDPDLK